MLSSMMGMSPPSHLDKSTTVPGSLLVSLELSQGWNLYPWPSSFLDSTPESGPFSRELGVTHKSPFSKRVGKSKRRRAGKAALKACYQCWYVTEPELRRKMQRWGLCREYSDTTCCAFFPCSAGGRCWRPTWSPFATVQLTPVAHSHESWVSLGGPEALGLSFEEKKKIALTLTGQQGDPTNPS